MRIAPRTSAAAASPTALRSAAHAAFTTGTCGYGKCICRTGRPIRETHTSNWAANTGNAYVERGCPHKKGARGHADTCASGHMGAPHGRLMCRTARTPYVKRPMREMHTGMRAPYGKCISACAPLTGNAYRHGRIREMHIGMGAAYGRRRHSRLRFQPRRCKPAPRRHVTRIRIPICRMGAHKGNAFAHRTRARARGTHTNVVNPSAPASSERARAGGAARTAAAAAPSDATRSAACAQPRDRGTPVVTALQNYGSTKTQMGNSKKTTGGKLIQHRRTPRTPQEHPKNTAVRAE